MSDLIERLRSGNADCQQAADEIERLCAIEDCAIDLIENIRERGLHDNWKRLASALTAPRTADSGGDKRSDDDAAPARSPQTAPAPSEQR